MSITPSPPIILSDAKFTAVDAETIGAYTIIIRDGHYLQLGTTPDVNACAKIIIILQSNGAFGENLLLKVVDVAGEARVTPIEAGDPDSTLAIGFSTNSTTDIDQNVVISVGGIFKAVVENGDTISIGDPIEKSNIDDGRIRSGGDTGVIGVALTSGTGDVAGTVTIQGMYSKNELF